MSKPRKQFCPKGHDTFITGRQKSGCCEVCHQERYKRTKKDKRKTQFCPKGHDKDVVGRDDHGSCAACKKARHPLKVGRPKTKVCPKGHNKDVVGRSKNGTCLKCIEERYPPSPDGKHKNRQQFCKRGHDTFIPENYKYNRCMLCLKERQIDKKKEIKRKRHEYYLRNRLRLREEQKEYARTHAKQIAKRSKKYRQEHKDEANAKIRVYRAKKMKTDPLYKLIHNLRRRLLIAVTREYKKGSAIKDLGCSIPFFKKYIEKKFYGKMTWKNYGSYWDLDHKKALMFFDLTKRSQFIKAVNYKNMQPLTKPDHKKKTRKEWKKLRLIRAKMKRELKAKIALDKTR